MIRYAVTVIENSLSTVMLVALLFAAVWREGGFRGRKALVWGCVLGSLAALSLAVLRRTTAINAGMVNAGVLALALVSGAVFGASRSLRAYSSAVLAGTLFFYTLPPLFLLPTEFVLAGQNVFSTEFLTNLAGAALGLALALLAGYALFQAGGSRQSAYGGLLGSLRGAQTPSSITGDTAGVLPEAKLPSCPPLADSTQRPRRGFGLAATAAFLAPRTPRIVLGALLFVTLAAYAAELARFLMARRIIPLWRGLFGVIMAAVNNRPFFIFLGIGIAALLPLALLFFKVPGGELAGAGRNPAETRKAKAALRRLRRYSGLALALLGFSVFALTGLKAWDRREAALSPPEPFTLAGEDILIPIERIEDGRLHRFVWNASEGTEVRFIVIKKSASAWGVGLDACDICGNTGYYERRDGVICKLCDVVMNKSTIGFKGGCNPVPLAYTVREGSMVVRTADLENEKGRFK